jgi:hypothetical protein
MDFILALSSSGPQKFDTILIVSDKFSKAKMLILGLVTWTAKDWAIALFKYLQLCN